MGIFEHSHIYFSMAVGEPLWIGIKNIAIIQQSSCQQKMKVD